MGIIVTVLDNGNQIASDDFKTDSSLDTNWIETTPADTVVTTGTYYRISSTHGIELYTTDGSIYETYDVGNSADQYSTMTYTDDYPGLILNRNQGGLVVRKVTVSGTTGGSYALLAQPGSPNTWFIQHIGTSPSTTVASTPMVAATTPVAGAIVRLEVVGTVNPVLRAYFNGTLFLIATDTASNQLTAHGKVGMHFAHTVGPNSTEAGYWEGGDYSNPMGRGIAGVTNPTTTLTSFPETPISSGIRRR